jgi:hypothetical protein
MKRYSLIIICCSALVSACGDPAPVHGSGAADSGLVDTLFLTDSVGVSMGDSCYVFGEIQDVICVPGGIALLDGVFSRVSLFSSDGVFLYSKGRRGEGPGEFLYPTRYCRLATGDSFVFDFDRRTGTILDDSLDYLLSYSMEWGMPLNIIAGKDSTIVLKQLAFDFIDDRLMAGYRISAVNAYTGEEGAVYRECMEEMGAARVDLRSSYCFYTADRQGNVYLADYDSDSYSIDVLKASGETLRRIEMESEPRPRFDMEVHQLVYLPITMPLTTESGISILEITEPELHPYVTFMEIDGDGNIWVRRMGLADSEYWDVISPEGELLQKVVLYADTAGSADYPSLHVSPYGMVATRNESEVERFYTVGWSNQ